MKEINPKTGIFVLATLLVIFFIQLSFYNPRPLLAETAVIYSVDQETKEPTEFKVHKFIPSQDGSKDGWFMDVYGTVWKMHRDGRIVRDTLKDRAVRFWDRTVGSYGR